MKCQLVNKAINSDYLNELLKEIGVTDIDSFLNPTDELIQSPDALDNMKEGWELLESALNDGKKIMLIIDCDVDGFTSSAILYQYLKSAYAELNPQIDYFIHEHKEHGLSDAMKDHAISGGDYGLVILPDAGTNDYVHIEQLKEVGTKVLILDHHLKDDTTLISDNSIIINNQLSPRHENKDLTGAGVVWKFIKWNDNRKNREVDYDFSDLAALGIISDMGSYLSLENRAIIKRGLENIKNYFFKCACEKQAYSMNNRINYTTIAFYITPMLNSMIRVGSQPEKERMFLAFVDGHRQVPCNKRGAKGTFEEVAIESLRECTNTKARQDKITTAAVEQLGVKIFNNNLLDNKLLFVELEDEDDFPQEVNGLVAMKLSAAYKRPTLVGRCGADGKIKGSIRGISNTPMGSMRDFLLSSLLFEYVSGHDQAAGHCIPAKKVDQLHEYANKALKDIVFSEDYYDVNFMRFAAETDLVNLINEVGAVPEIWGQNCKEPLIYIKDINLTKSDIQIIGARKDTLKFEKFGVTYIKFFAKDMIEKLDKYSSIKLEVVGKATVNEWMGRCTPQILIENYEVKDDEWGF